MVPSVKVPVAIKDRVSPTKIVGAYGERVMVVSSAGVTVTSALALPPLRKTVIRVLPALMAVTGTGTVSCPALKKTGDSTVATLDAELFAVSTPDVLGVGDREAVNVPVAPTVMLMGLGERSVGTGF